MDFHVERQLRINSDPEYNSLYSWAINELHEDGQTSGNDQIPWRWSLYFTAVSCVLRDSIKIISNYEQASQPNPAEIVHLQTISIKLKPGDSRDRESYRQTNFSMFGTDRVINSFHLDIYSIQDPSEHEDLSAWGSVSYTAETDFRNETTDDIITFYMKVRPETFARYAANISMGFASEIILRVAMVDGFYAEWSPSIWTRNIKVLASGDEQKVEFPPSIQLMPPRLGYVGEAELNINNTMEFGRDSTDPEVVRDNLNDARAERVVSNTGVQSDPDPKTIKQLSSLTKAIWTAAVASVAILVVLLLKL